MKKRSEYQSSTYLISFFFAVGRDAGYPLKGVDFYQSTGVTFIRPPQARASFVKSNLEYLAKHILQHSASHIVQRESMR